MSKVTTLVLTVLLCGLAAAPQPARAQTTLTMSSWVSPQHHLTAVVLQGWATEVEKATNGRVKFQMLPKHPSAPPGTFDAVRDGLVRRGPRGARHPLVRDGKLPPGPPHPAADARIARRRRHRAGQLGGLLA